MKVVSIENPMKKMISAIVSSIEGIEWPLTAEFCVEYQLKCWPMGFDGGHKKYFDTQEDMETWLDSQREWACQEDNEMSYVILKWDLGPTFVTSGHYW